MSDAASSLPPDEVAALVEINLLATYLGLVVASLLIYDTACTLDQEVKYIWNARNTNLLKVVFFLNRYGGIFGAVVNILFYLPNPSLPECNLSQWGRDTSYWITIISLDYVLMVRVVALYHNNRRLKLILSLLLVLEAIAKPAFIIVGTISDQVVVGALTPTLSQCTYNAPGLEFSYIMNWVVPIAYGAILLCLALYKSIVLWRLNGLRGYQLMLVIIRDQALYYSAAIACSILNILDDLIDTTSVGINLMQAFGSPTLLCILGSHMVFNLQEAADRGVNIGTNWSSQSTEGVMRFGDRPDEEEPNAIALGDMQTTYDTEQFSALGSSEQSLGHSESPSLGSKKGKKRAHALG